MIELDQNGIQTNFGAKDLIILPKCDPKDIDSYVILERLMIMQGKIKRMENCLNENVAKVIMHKEQLGAAVENIKTHETLIRGSLMPTEPPYAELLSKTSCFGSAKSKSTHGFL